MPRGRNSKAFITKIAGYLRIRILMNRRYFFRIFGINIFLKLRRFCFFWFKFMMHPTAAVENNHCGPVHYITIGDSRLRSVALVTGLWDAESIIFNRGRSTGRYFIPLNGPLNGHPPSCV